MALRIQKSSEIRQSVPTPTEPRQNRACPSAVFWRTLDAYTMKTLCIITIGLISCCWCSAEEVELTDGNSLLARCELALKPDHTVEERALATFFMGYLHGFSAGVGASAGSHHEPAPFDVPPSVTLLQKVRVIKKWLEEHPKMLNTDHAYLCGWRCEMRIQRSATKSKGGQVT